MTALAARRRHPAALVVLLVLGLFLVGGLYAAFAPKASAVAPTAAAPEEVAQGKALFLANCASCHGTAAVGTEAGPSLVGVGSAAVDFQMGTGRMPLAGPGVQAGRTDQIKFTQEQIDNIGAWVATLGPGPSIPDAEMLDPTKGDPAKGGELFRVNCAMCHNYAGSGGALTRGKYAPSLRDVEPRHIYGALLTGPQSMPVFNDANISPEGKRDIIAFLTEIDQNNNPGGMNLGNLGPVSEGMFIWVFGLVIMIGAAVWLGAKAA